MAPRATVQQAIELLKIHQLRRENAAIHQQLQALRDEVSDARTADEEIRDQLDQTQKEIRSIYASTTQHSSQFKTVNISIDSFIKCTDSLQSSVESLRDSFTTQSEHYASQYTKLSDRVGENEKTCIERGEEHGRTQKELDNKLKIMNQQPAQRTILEDSICNRLDKVENQIATIQNEQRGVNCTDQIHGSIEEATRPVDKGSNENVSKNIRDDRLDRTSTTELDSELMLTLDPGHGARNSTIPNDLDLDESTTHVDHAEHSVNSHGCSNFSIMLPHQVNHKKDQTDRALDLQQGPLETIAEYLTRGLRLTECSSGQIESVILHRFVEGLVDKKHQDVFTRWFASTSWSKKNLRDIACTHGVNATSLQEHGAARLRNDTHELNKESKQQHQSNVLVPATETDSPSTDHEAERVVEKSVPAPVQLQPRRSQRLAAKSQSQPQTNPTIAVETESQAKALNARIALAAQEHAEPSYPAPCVPKKRKRAECEVLTKNKTLAVNLIRDHNHDRDDKVSRAASSLRTNQKVTQNRRENKTGTVNIPKLLHTPTRRIFPARVSKPPQMPVTQPPNPLFSKTAKARHRPHKTLATVPEKAGSKPSPYRPRPRLVSKASREIQQTSWHAEMTSDLDISLPRPKNKNITQQQVDYADKQQGFDPPRKKRRLPLPPPPMIPILSTSTEEDRRFDQW